MKEKIEDLNRRLEAAVREGPFDTAELLGFQSDPMLALRAGAVIGYGMALEDFIQRMTETEKKLGITERAKR